jgi:hypothetical protein
MDFTEKGQTKETATIIFLIVNASKNKRPLCIYGLLFNSRKKLRELEFSCPYTERNLSTSQEIWHLSSDR